MAEGAGAALLHAGASHLSALAGVDADRVWRWGYVERVTTGLYLAWHGFAEEARSFLDTASVLARQS
jgi:streptomycin 6-kinase